MCTSKIRASQHLEILQRERERWADTEPYIPPLEPEVPTVDVGPVPMSWRIVALIVAVVICAVLFCNDLWEALHAAN
jgi:hypothetical protein